MREFSFTTSYIRHPDTAALLQAITALCEAEGMKRLTDPPVKRFHHASALLNNRWKMDVLVGQSSWHLLLAKPWNLLAERAAGADASRLVQLARHLHAGAFLICQHDNYPDEHGEVLLETNGTDQIVTGHWHSQEPDDPEAPAAWDSDAHFYGTPFLEKNGSLEPQSALLKKLWQQSEAIWSGPNAADYDDCRADDSNELKQRYLIKRLLDISPYDVIDDGTEYLAKKEWAATRLHTLWFEWPGGDRPEPPEPEAMPPPDVRYPSGDQVEVGDAVLISDTVNLKPGRVSNFLYGHRADGPGWAVNAVAVDEGGLGELAQWVETRPGVTWTAARLVARGQTDTAQAKVLGIKAIQQNAEKGNAEAQLAWAVRLLQGDSVPKDVQKMQFWLTQASKHDDHPAAAQAHALLGGLAESDKKPFIAIQHFRKAADAGVRQAQFKVALMHHQARKPDGTGIQTDVYTAIQYYSMAVAQGSRAAEYNLLHIKLGTQPAPYFEEDELQAQRLRGLADGGDVVAQWLYGLNLEYGREGAEQDVGKALHYYRLGAAQNFGPAICNLADKLENGVGVEPDLAQAHHLYLQAAQMHVNAASFSLGGMYRDGRGVPQSMEKAVEWFKKAIDQGFGEQAKQALDAMPNSAIQNAQRMAIAISNPIMPNDAPPIERDAAYQAASDIHEVDDEVAMKLCLALYSYAGMQGHSEALHQVAFFHQRGQAGLQPQMSKALQLYTQSAELGNLNSQMKLVEIYENGEDGVPKDAKLAKHWLQIAAKQPSAYEAKYKLGLRDSPEPSMRELGMQMTDEHGQDITEAWEQQLRGRRSNSKATVTVKPWWKWW